METVDKDFIWDVGWLHCQCGGEVYVALERRETYPCPECQTELRFQAEEFQAEDALDAEFIDA